MVSTMDKLKEVLEEVADDSKKGRKFIKKYNLSLLDIRILQMIIDGKCDECFYFKLIPVLNDFKIPYIIDDDKINFVLLEE